MAFFGLIILLVVDALFENISGVQHRKYAVIGDMGFSGTSASELSVGPISSTQSNPTHNPYNQQQTFGYKDFNISPSVKVYQVLLIYQYLSLSGYQVLL